MQNNGYMNEFIMSYYLYFSLCKNTFLTNTDFDLISGFYLGDDEQEPNLQTEFWLFACYLLKLVALDIGLLSSNGDGFFYSLKECSNFVSKESNQHWYQLQMHESILRNKYSAIYQVTS